MALISVIIPVYKVEEYLENCIQSVIKQTVSDLEIILVDDGSPDQCPEICDLWADKDSRIKVIHKENGGLSDARNAGLDIAQGEYLSFVDSDDWIAPDMYEIMLEALKREQADICACGIMGCYPSRNVPMPVCPAAGDSKRFFSMLYSDALYPVAACNKLYKRECWSKLRFPKGRICEDSENWMILDDNRQLAVVHPADRPFYLTRLSPDEIERLSLTESTSDPYEELWKGFFTAIAIKERSNPDCQRTHLPLHYRDHMPEFKNL